MKSQLKKLLIFLGALACGALYFYVSILAAQFGLDYVNENQKNYNYIYICALSIFLLWIPAIRLLLSKIGTIYRSALEKLKIARNK